MTAGTVACNGTSEQSHKPDLGYMLRRLVGTDADEHNTARITGRLATDAALRFTGGDKPSALYVLQISQPGGALDIVAQVIVGTDLLAHIAASHTVRMLRKGARVRVDGISLGLKRGDGGVTVLELRGVHDLLLLSPAPARHETQEAQR